MTDLRDQLTPDNATYIADAIAYFNGMDSTASRNMARAIMALADRLADCERERDALRAFAQDALADFCEGDWDGGSRQDCAVKHGLLREVEVTEPCGEYCNCAEYGDFPMICCKRTPTLTGKPDAAIDEQTKLKETP